jgi:hypothetical protein
MIVLDARIMGKNVSKHETFESVEHMSLQTAMIISRTRATLNPTATLHGQAMLRVLWCL